MDDRSHRFAFNKIIIFFILALFVSFSSSKIDIKLIAENLKNDLETIKNEELGVLFTEKLYSNFKYITRNNSVSNEVKSIAHKLEVKINNVFSSISNSSVLLQNISSKVLIVPSIFLPCMKEETDIAAILSEKFFDGDTSGLETFKSFSKVLNKLKNNMSKGSESIKQQYYISDRELKKIPYSPFDGCPNEDETTIWTNYIKRHKYDRKNIILLLDHGGSLSKFHFDTVKILAKYIISSLNKNDRISVIGVSADCSIPDNTCDDSINDMADLININEFYVEMLNNFVNSLTQGNGATNHLLGLKKALEIAHNNQHLLKNETLMILYISRGLLSSLIEARNVVELIANYTNDLRAFVVINTCAVIDESKPVMYETHFLRDIATQNFSKYNVTFKENSYRKIGQMLTVNKTEDIGFVVHNFFQIFNTRNEFYTEKRISLPTWDHITGDLLVSFTSGWNQNGFHFVGADIFFSDLAEDITYYSSNQLYSYAFLMNNHGIVLMHPSMPRPSIVSHQIKFVDLNFIEKVENMDNLKRRMLIERDGTFITKNNMSQTVEYIWSHVNNWYIVCIVTNKNYGPFNKPFKAPPSASVSKLIYQNFERSEENKLCRNLNQIVTLDVGSLYLSMSCFQSPFTATHTSQDKLVTQGYLAYLKDNTGFLINPGLKKEVKDEVSAMSHLLDFLRKKHLSSELSKYIVRRYVSSYNGVLQIFPGTILKNNLETTKRTWFVRALQHKEKIVLIPPYLDKSGAGYVVTMSYAGKHTVLSVDFTYGFMFKLLLRHSQLCLEDKITCFLIDDQGYIIYHPDLMDIHGTRAVEQQHIVHKEPFIANDILNHKYFIKKLSCNNYSDSTVQRYYRLNTSFNEILTNHVPGDHCVSYRILKVPNTNIFLGIKNVTCDVVATFCPCSVVDRLCLNCNRMEQKECECPCECPLDLTQNEVCKLSKDTDSLPCTEYTENSSVEPHFKFENDNNNNNIEIDNCMPINCQNEVSDLDCIGLLGCEWCKYDIDGNYLKKPFCSSINSCFKGVFGLSTSYRGEIMRTSLPVDSEYSPVGPILGSVIALTVLFMLLFICYRSYTNPAIDRLYLSSGQDQLRMSDLNVNDLGNHRDKLLKDDIPNPISPYCVASTYRRANTAADSDHGYSTMTPHDESEHMSLAPIEVDSLEDDVLSDNTSVHTSMSNKTNKNNVSHNISPMFTKIPNRNCVVVPVTVHRHMEAT